MGAFVSAGTGKVDEILKRMYDSKPHDALNNKHNFFKRIPKEYNKDGKEIMDLHRTGGTGSMGYQAERDALQAAGSQSWSNGTITPYDFWASLEISNRLVNQAKTSGGTWYTRFKSEIDGYIKDVMVRKEIYAFGGGDSKIGKIKAVSNTTVTLDSSAADHMFQHARKARVGTRVEFFNGVSYADTRRQNTSAAADSDFYATVSNVTISGTTATITFDQDIDSWSTSAVANNDYMHFFRGRTATSSQTSPCLALLVNSTAYPAPSGTSALQGIDPATNSWWQSSVLSNSGTNRPITETLLQQAIDSAFIASGSEIDMFTCSFGARLDYAVGQLNLRRNMNTTQIAGATAGGFTENLKDETSVQYGALTFYPSRFHEPNVINGLEMKDLCLYYWAPLTWWQDGAGMFRRAYDGSTTWMAEQFCYDAFVVRNRNHHVRVADVDESEVSVI